MANSKISGLTTATTPLAGTEELALLQTSDRRITVANFAAGAVKSNATTGVLQVVGPVAASTRVMTTPDANFTVARTDAGQTFTGVQTFDTTISVGGATPSASGAGITFPATQSASTDANTLDDYEEGTWTPVLQFDANTQSIAINKATYVKIGKAVNINMQITWSAKSGSGRVYITGLPFAKETGGTVAVMGACLGGSVTTTEALFYNIDPGQTVLNFAQQTGDINSASLATGGSLMCTGTYFV
jgi:hypothetical protein